MYNGVCIIVLGTVYNEVYRKMHSKGVQYNVKEGMKESVPKVLGQLRQILISQCIM